MYGSIPSAAKFRTPEGKACVNMIVNIFRYPPGQEPKKTGDDGKGGKKQLEEKEDNPSSPKVSRARTHGANLKGLVLEPVHGCAWMVLPLLGQTWPQDGYSARDHEDLPFQFCCFVCAVLGFFSTVRNAGQLGLCVL